MSVIVKGMVMPSECEYCGFCRYYHENGNVWCNAKNRLLKQRWKEPHWTHLDVKRPEWCPLIELPEKHGRLIDERVAYDKIAEQEGGYYMDMDGVDCGLEETPTVIEAEGDEG